MHSLDLER